MAVIVSSQTKKQKSLLQVPHTPENNILVKKMVKKKKKATVDMELFSSVSD